jgi:hypothetical protein
MPLRLRGLESFHHQLPAENGHFPPIFVYQWIGRASISANFSAK